MSSGDTCARSDHRPPPGGGSCPCGMVTRIPPRRPAFDVRAVLARCLSDGADDLTGPGGADAVLSGLSVERADRLLAALTAAGLVLAPDAGRRQLA